MVVVYPRLIIVMAAILGVLFFLALHYDPARPAAKVLRQGVAGLALVLLWNALPILPLGVNPLSAWLAGALGLPGIGLLSVLSQLP